MFSTFGLEKYNSPFLSLTLPSTRTLAPSRSILARYGWWNQIILIFSEPSETTPSLIGIFLRQALLVLSPKILPKITAWSPFFKLAILATSAVSPYLVGK